MRSLPFSTPATKHRKEYQKSEVVTYRSLESIWETTKALDIDAVLALITFF